MALQLLQTVRQRTTHVGVYPSPNESKCTNQAPLNHVHERRTVSQTLVQPIPSHASAKIHFLSFNNHTEMDITFRLYSACCYE